MIVVSLDSRQCACIRKYSVWEGGSVGVVGEGESVGVVGVGKSAYVCTNMQTLVVSTHAHMKRVYVCVCSCVCVDVLFFMFMWFLVSVCSPVVQSVVWLL